MDLRSKILQADDYTYEKVAVPEWDCELWVRSMSADEKDSFEESLSKEVKRLRKNKVVTERKSVMRGARAKIVQFSVCKDNGNPELLFTPEDVAALGAKNSKPIDRIFEVASKLSAIGEDDLAELTGN